MNTRDIHEGHEYCDWKLDTKMVVRIINPHLSASNCRVQWESGDKKGECSLAAFARWAQKERPISEH